MAELSTSHGHEVAELSTLHGHEVAVLSTSHPRDKILCNCFCAAMGVLD